MKKFTAHMKRATRTQRADRVPSYEHDAVDQDDAPLRYLSDDDEVVHEVVHENLDDHGDDGDMADDAYRERHKGERDEDDDEGECYHDDHSGGGGGGGDGDGDSGGHEEEDNGDQDRDGGRKEDESPEEEGIERGLRGQLAAKKAIELMRNGVTTIDLTECDIGDEGALALGEELGANTSLVTLDLEANGIRGEGGVALAKALHQNSSLTSLSLKSNSIGVDGAVAFAHALSVNVTLCSLNLGSNPFPNYSHNDIGDDGVLKLVDALGENAVLTSLDLSFNGISEVGAEAIADLLITNTSLQVLSLSGNKIGDDGAVELGEGLGKNSSLMKLNLQQNNIGSDGAVGLGEGLDKNSSLTELNLSQNKIGDDGAVGLGEGLGKNSSLTELNLRANKIGDDGAVGLGEALGKNSSLTELNLGWNNIGDDGAVGLGKGLGKNSSLTELNLERNNIGDGGAVRLGEALGKNSSLTSLNLSGNKIGDKGAVRLVEALGKNRSLTSLNLEKSKIDLNGEMSVVKALLTENDGLRKIFGLPQLPSLEWSTLLRASKGEPRMKRIREYLFDRNEEKWTSAAHELAGKSAHMFAIFLVILFQYNAETQMPLDTPAFWLLKRQRTNENDNAEQDEDDAPPLIHALFDCHTRSKFSLPKQFCKDVLAKVLSLKDGLLLMKAEDEGGRTVRSLALTNKNTKGWAKTYGTYLDRYSVAEGPPVHESKTCAVHYATDIQENEAVALKIMRKEEQYFREIDARKSRASEDADLKGCLPLLHRNDPKFADRLDNELCLVMTRGSRSLFEAINTERFAGRNLQKIRTIAYRIISAVQELHQSGRIHGDIKPRNVVRVSDPKLHTFSDEDKGDRLTVPKKWRENVTGEQTDDITDEEWQLIDLDASAPISTPEKKRLVTEKMSTGYAAPELAKWNFLHKANRSKAPQADPAIDVWGFGVVLFQMLSGTKLFMVDESDDNLVTTHDKTELMNWLVLDDERLQRIQRRGRDTTDDDDDDIANTSNEDGLDVGDYEIEAARDLVRLCLRGDPEERISVKQIIEEHPFFETFQRGPCEPSEEVQDIDASTPARESRVGRMQARFSTRVMSLHRRVVSARFSLFGRTTQTRLHRSTKSSDFYNQRARNELIELPAYHFFLSHMQMQAAGIAKDLAAGLERHRMSSWIDMNAAEIHLRGMHRGVLSSQCFVMVLTKDVLSRPYCLAELHFAVEFFGATEDGLAKKIFFIVEEDTRFDAWSESNVPWHCPSKESTAGDVQSDREEAGDDEASSHSTGLSKLAACNFWLKRKVDVGSSRRDLQQYDGDEANAATPESRLVSLRKSLDELKLQNWEGEIVRSEQILSNARKALDSCVKIPYRRRQFEEEEMLRALAQCAGFQAIPRPKEKYYSNKKEVRVAVVGTKKSKAVKKLGVKLGEQRGLSVNDDDPHVIVVVLERDCWDDVQTFWENLQGQHEDEGDEEGGGGEEEEEKGHPLLAVAVCGTKEEWDFNHTDKFEPALRAKLFDRLEVLMWRDAPGAEHRYSTNYYSEHEEPALIHELCSRAKRLQRSSLKPRTHSK